jgi:hypothetical protein
LKDLVKVGILDDKAQTLSYEHYYPYGGTAIIAGKDKTKVQQKRYRYTGKERNDNSGFAGRVLVKSRYGTAVCLSSYSRRPTIRCKIFMHISTTNPSTNETIKIYKADRDYPRFYTLWKSS